MTLAIVMIGGMVAAVALAAAVSPSKPAAGFAPAHLQEGDWHLLTVRNLSDAERLLDYLEVTGYAERELVVLGDSSFAVRWR